jgi:hypothetical protein
MAASDRGSMSALALVCKYKLGFDNDLVSDKNVIVTPTVDEQKKLTTADCQLLGRALIDQGGEFGTRIEYLLLAGNEFGDNGVGAIASAMEAGALPSLLTVDFSRCAATDVGFASLVGMIRCCTRFRDVVYCENVLSDVGFRALHEVLKRDEWPNIERLHLAGAPAHRHAIGDASFVPFATDLAEGAIRAVRLEELELSDNEVGDAGFAALATAIQRGHLRKLRSLYLVSNRITDDGAEALAAAITNNKRTALDDVRLGFQSADEPHARRVSSLGKVAIEAAGESLGRTVHCTLAPIQAPLDPSHRSVF